MAEIADNLENKVLYFYIVRHRQRLTLKMCKLLNHLFSSQAPSRKQPGIILVSDVPSEFSQNDIWIYFQQKKNSGGEVLDVLMKTDRREAVVYFEDYEGKRKLLFPRVRGLGWEKT